MRLAIFAAFPQEIRCSLHKLRARRIPGRHPFTFFSASYASKEILLIQAGMGLRNAEAALKYTLEEHGPLSILSAGFGGALYPEAEIGDLIWPSRVYLVDGEAVQALELSGAGETAKRISEKIGIHEGSVLTLNSLVKKSGIKEALFQGLPFPVCDMETFVMARIAKERGLPFFAIRSITDRAGEDIPPALYDVADESGNYRLSRALMLLLRNPGLIPAGVKLGRNSGIASRKLWQAIRFFIETI